MLAGSLLVLAAIAAAPVQDESETERAVERKELAAPELLLEELIERSRRIKTCSARWRMTVSNEEAPRLVRLDYQAPDRIRLDMRHGRESSESWCNGSVASFRGVDRGRKFHGRIDTEDQLAVIAKVTAVLQREFPSETASLEDASALGAGVSADWSFDPATQDGLFLLTLTPQQLATPFGWLTTLQRKGARLTAAGGAVRFATDEGRVEGSLSAATGVLETFRANGKHATILLELESVGIDQPLEPGRLEVPADPPEGEDLSAVFRARPLSEMLRHTVQTAIFRASGTGTWDEPARAKITTVLRAMLELDLEVSLGSWLDDLRAWIAEWRELAMELRQREPPDAAVEEALAPAREGLTAQLDDAETRYVASCHVNGHASSPERAADLLALERELAAQVFRERIREPLLAELERALAAGR